MKNSAELKLFLIQYGILMVDLFEKLDDPKISMEPKRILLFSDVENWAFDIDAKNIKKYAKKFVIDTCVRGDKVTKKYDLIHYMNYLDCPSDMNRHMAEIATASVASYNFLKKLDKFKEKITKFHKVNTISSNLNDIVKKYRPDVLHIQKGVDLNLFTPHRKNRNTKVFTVLWVGQMPTKLSHDVKGMFRILMPLIKSLAEYEDTIEIIIHANTYQNALPYDRMPTIYHRADCLIGTSECEGFQNSLLEAAACGLPVISTNVGVAPEFITHGKNGFLVDNYYDKDEDFINEVVSKFKKYIFYLSRNRDVSEEMGKRNRDIMEKKWRWKYMAEKWENFFNRALE